MSKASSFSKNIAHFIEITSPSAIISQNLQVVSQPYVSSNKNTLLQHRSERTSWIMAKSNKGCSIPESFFVGNLNDSFNKFPKLKGKLAHMKQKHKLKTN